MSTATKIRRSQATFLQFPAERTFTPLEFWHICNCLALQASAGKPDGSLTSLQWMLAYWGADTYDLSRHDRAEMFFYGRDGFGGEKWNPTLGELINQMTDGYPEDALEDPMISAENVNTLIQWAFDKFINWAPEPVSAPKAPFSAYDWMLQAARVSVMISQFTDHFEEFEMQALASNLVKCAVVDPDLWALLASGKANIEVQYGTEPDDNTRTLVINGGQWKIHYDEDHLDVEGPDGLIKE